MMYHYIIMNSLRKADDSLPPIISSTSDHEDWFDRAALGASFLCLVHCLALPLLFAALPALSHVIAIPESFHVWILLFAVPASGAALLGGRARHRASWPSGAGACGLLCLVLGAFAVERASDETAITVAGSLMLAAAHVANWRLRHRVGCASAHGPDR